MKLFRFGPSGAEKPGVWIGDERVDASGFGGDWDERFFGGDGLSRLAAWVRSDGARAPRVPSGARLGPAVARPSKLVCIGLNYRDHAHETGAAIPTEPVIFMKATSALAGPNDDVPTPLGSDKLDYEAELALVIGRDGRSIREEDAWDHVFGFCVANDVSQRDLQRAHGGQWLKGKSIDRTMPLGPWITTIDEVPDPADLTVECEVDGRLLQRASTGEMAFPIPTLIAELSRGMTLRAGDVLLTGTPSGIGNARDPQVFLADGNIIETRVSGLGTLRNRVTKTTL
jgi:2-keto-4-pentenoate hydratase/2-oxohepta-3-ene-1,7-dioic acid hydratase in catechol pathway